MEGQGDTADRVCFSTPVTEEDSQAEKAHRAIGRMNFRQELRSLINRFSMENGSDTADYILADYLMSCLDAFDTATRLRGLDGKIATSNNEE